jgi:hypothetical protein
MFSATVVLYYLTYHHSLGPECMYMFTCILKLFVTNFSVVGMFIYFIHLFEHIMSSASHLMFSHLRENNTKGIWDRLHYYLVWNIHHNIHCKSTYCVLYLHSCCDSCFFSSHLSTLPFNTRRPSVVISLL